MRIILFLSFSALFACKGYPQTSQCDTVYQFVDEMPVYKKNPNALIEDVQNKLIFDKGCKPSDLRQIVWTIDQKGKVIDVNVNGMDTNCQKKISDQAKQFNEWTPGKLKGKPVCVKITLPVHIRP